LRSESVLPIVADLARLHGSEVLLVHVVTEPTSTAILSGPDDMTVALSLASRVQAKAEEYLARIRARLLPQVPAVKTLVARRAEERQALLDVAVDQSADMVVLTAHGTTCNAERAFGSVTSYVLAHARLPVFVFQDMPHGARDPAPGAGARTRLSVRPLEMD
jgi:nucleotide-binding universal stress UspA family protein